MLLRTRDGMFWLLTSDFQASPHPVFRAYSVLYSPHGGGRFWPYALRICARHGHARMRLPQPTRCATCAGSPLGESPGPNCYKICARVPTLPTLVSRSIIGAAGRETPNHERRRRACARTRSLPRITYSGELAHCLSMIVPVTAPAASPRGLASEPESEPIAPPPVDASLRTRAVSTPSANRM